MYLIEPKRNEKWVFDPGVNMALQEYVKDELFLDDDVVFPYMMHPAVQIGKYQNAYEEVNQAYMEENNIQIVRRETGGGAIYLDDQNMSFCFLLSGDLNIYGNYERLYEPVVQALEKLGISGIKQEGRNDLILDGKKISGAAMTVQSGRVYAGYSLLLDPNYEVMTSVLNPNAKKITSHGIQSVRSRVGSIRSHLSSTYQHMTVWDFTEYILCELLEIEKLTDAKRYVLTDEDWDRIDKITKDKYHNWDWNYGRFQQFSYERTARFSAGTIQVGLEITFGKVSAIQFFGDFFGTKDKQDIEQALTGIRLKKEDLLQALLPFHLNDYFGHITTEAFVDFLLSEEDKEKEG